VQIVKREGSLSGYFPIGVTNEVPATLAMPDDSCEWKSAFVIRGSSVLAYGRVVQIVQKEKRDNIPVFLPIGLTKEDPATVTLPEATWHWKSAVVIECSSVRAYGREVQIVQKEKSFVASFFPIGVTNEDPATLTLPEDSFHWKSAFVISVRSVLAYGREVQIVNREGSLSGYFPIGVTNEVPATLTLPDDSCEWKSAFVIRGSSVLAYGRVTLPDNAKITETGMLISAELVES
ncbi:hypothetical protein BaRGS_00009810, partial [Batillaria attramentaria]